MALIQTRKSENEPLVSIVIPVYNAAPYLEECLDSLIAQSWKNLDIVCVNDGSQDASLSLLEQYAEKDRRIRIFSKENEGRGAASARNRGLAEARGEYVQFCDSDDFFEPDMVESLVKKSIETGAEVVICRGQVYDHGLQRVTGKLSHPDLQYVPSDGAFSWKECPKYICEIADFYAWNKLYKRALLDEYDLHFVPIPIVDDQDISMIGPVVARKVAAIDRAFINYRVRTGTSQCDTQSRHPESAYEGCTSVVKRFKELGIWEEVKESYLNVSIRLMREYFDRMNEYEKLDFLYQKYRNEVFPMLDAAELEPNCFHDSRIWEWYRMIQTKTLGEILFETAKASGSPMTTAPLRFRVPYHTIKKNSKIVLVGKGIAGRYWYSQLLLSNYCEIVFWVEHKDQIPEGIEYDSIVEAR